MFNHTILTDLFDHNINHLPAIHRLSKLFETDMDVWLQHRIQTDKEQRALPWQCIPKLLRTNFDANVYDDADVNRMKSCIKYISCHNHCFIRSAKSIYYWLDRHTFWSIYCQGVYQDGDQSTVCGMCLHSL